MTERVVGGACLLPAFRRLSQEEDHEFEAT